LQLQCQARSLIRRFRQNIAISKELLLDSESSIQGTLCQVRCGVKPIRSPTVPAGRERVRICIHAHNTKHETDALLKAVETYFRSEPTTIHAKL
ncbi:hypothetical protein K493DRAFT_205056, partial [Basidiobolus meristosporus CBS 931.73]